MQHAGACLGHVFTLLLQRLHVLLLRLEDFGGRYQPGVDIRTAAAAAIPQNALLLLKPLQALHTRARGEQIVLKAPAATSHELQQRVYCTTAATLQRSNHAAEPASKGRDVVSRTVSCAAAPRLRCAATAAFALPPPPSPADA